MTVIEVNEKGILFTTGRPKDLYRQLSKNPRVELCFYNAAENKQVRIHGRAELSKGLETKKKAVEKFSFLKAAVKRKGYGIIAPYYLRQAKALIWKREDDLKPKKYIEI